MEEEQKVDLQIEIEKNIDEHQVKPKSSLFKKIFFWILILILEFVPFFILISINNNPDAGQVVLSFAILPLIFFVIYFLYPSLKSIFQKFFKK